MDVGWQQCLVPEHQPQDWGHSGGTLLLPSLSSGDANWVMPCWGFPCWALGVGQVSLPSSPWSSADFSLASTDQWEMLWLMQAVMCPLGALRLQQPFTLQCTQRVPGKLKTPRLMLMHPCLGSAVGAPLLGAHNLFPPVKMWDDDPSQGCFGSRVRFGEMMGSFAQSGFLQRLTYCSGLRERFMTSKPSLLNLFDCRSITVWQQRMCS